MKRAYVLGGGVAGMTAALGLADRGHEVTLLESRRQLGGRAFAFHDRASSRRLDNGPHVMLGCYRSTRALLRRLGTEDRFERQRSLAMAYRCAGGVVTRLSLPRLPVPLAMPFGLLGLGLGFGSKLRAMWGMATTLFGAGADLTLDDWLRRRAQHGEPTDFLWQPLCRAIMNVEPEAAAAADFLFTLRTAFMGSAGGAAFWLPKVTWSEILGDPAPDVLAGAGVTLRTGARVTAMRSVGGRVTAIELGCGETIRVDGGTQIVAAMPWFALAKLLPGAVPAFGTLRSSPIVSAHFAIAANAAPLADDGPVVALPNGDPFHFVLRRPGAPAREFAMLSGGSRAFDGMQVDAIEAVARRQLARFYPGFDPATAATVRISKENLATFIARPGSRALRPKPGRLASGPDNMLVCGDWTDTGLPSTLEGAARSAEMLLAGVS
ncbi:MAG: hydroxysqualene dehydroxylase HpnE [Planctomycetes bacterium]|nr:hydroxysqualene dehydroxylase HpnE [Planctomycetota bacterium]